MGTQNTINTIISQFFSCHFNQVCGNSLNL